MFNDDQRSGVLTFWLCYCCKNLFLNGEARSIMLSLMCNIDDVPYREKQLVRLIYIQPYLASFLTASQRLNNQWLAFLGTHRDLDGGLMIQPEDTQPDWKTQMMEIWVELLEELETGGIPPAEMSTEDDEVIRLKHLMYWGTI